MTEPLGTEIIPIEGVQEIRSHPTDKQHQLTESIRCWSGAPVWPQEASVREPTTLGSRLFLPLRTNTLPREHLVASVSAPGKASRCGEVSRPAVEDNSKQQLFVRQQLWEPCSESLLGP